MSGGKLADNRKISIIQIYKGLSYKDSPFSLYKIEKLKMKNYDVKQALPIIVKAAKEYEEKLNNYHFLIIYIEKTQLNFVV